jgi:hypothetical protein
MLWHVLTILEVRSDVLPPAFLSTQTDLVDQRGTWVVVRERGPPCNVYKFGAQCPHALYTIQEILKTLETSSAYAFNSMVVNWAYLSSPWREILERPPYFLLLCRLVDFLADFHDEISAATV